MEMSSFKLHKNVSELLMILNEQFFLFLSNKSVLMIEMDIVGDIRISFIFTYLV